MYVLSKNKKNIKKFSTENFLYIIWACYRNVLHYAGVSVSKPEEQRLREENQRLREEIEKLKVKLVLTEVRNGGKMNN